MRRLSKSTGVRADTRSPAGSIHRLYILSIGVAGLYDYGPPGSSLQANIIAEWRKHFIVEDHMLEIDSTIMTPAPVFETSGHVARFADWMVKDSKTGDVLRADHLVKGVLEARLAGDKEARGLVAQPQKDGEKKKKKAVKTAAVQLPDDAVKEYEVMLAQVRGPTPRSCIFHHGHEVSLPYSWITIQAQS
jgi:glycyl-tRNA synthetase (class II)